MVEVKTGNAPLEADQVNAYWDVARSAGFDAVVTISNEIAPAPDAHPTDGLKVKSNSKVKVHHLSWTGLLSAAVMIKVHHGVDDPEQAWLLGELIRYLEHPASGAMAFNDIRAKRLAAALTVSAPADRGARGRCGWLVNQLKGAPGDLIIEAYPKKARMPNTATLSAVRESRDLLLDTERREPIRFRIVQHADMGQNRKAGRRTPGFIDSVTGLIETFYGSVVQNVSRWSPPAPRMTQAEERPSTEDSQRPEAEAHA